MGQVAKERRRHSSGGGVRIFIAAYPPAEVVETLAAAARGIEGLPACRWTPAEQVHLTLLFVGEVDPRRVETVIESAERAAAGIESFELAPDRLITLPERGPARLLAATAPGSPSLGELAVRLARRLATPRRRGDRIDADRFLPHLTLLRFRAPVARFAIDRPIPAAPFRVERIAVMRSVLGREGAEHRELREIPLVM